MKNKDYGIAPEVRFGIGTPTEVTLSALIQHNYDMPDYGVQALNGRPSPVPKSTFYGLTTDRTIQDIQTFTAGIKHKLSDNLILTNQAQFSHSMTDARETAPQAVLTGPRASSTALTNGNFTTLSPSQLFIKLQSHDRVIENHSLYNDTMLEYKFVTGPIKHDLIAGIDLGHDSYSNQAYTRNNLPVLTMLDRAFLSSPSGVTTTVGNYADSGSNEIGAYVNDTVSIGQHWKVSGGLRWDRFQAQIHNTISLPSYATQTNYVRVPGYTRWDATAAYHAKQYEVRLNLLNLTNKQYYDALIPSDGGGSVPGIGRTLLATFDYRF